MSQVHEKNAFLNTTGTEWKTWTVSTYTSVSNEK